MYDANVPKLWTETIEAHRDAVRNATLDTTAALVARQGMASVTMSQIAKEAGIGRATLYKYFPDIESIMTAWHERLIDGHLRHLAEIRNSTDGAGARLEAVLSAYALMAHGHRDGGELSALLHQGEHVAQAHQHLRDFIKDLLTEGAAAGEIRGDVPPGELASYCLYALTAAGSLPSTAAVHRLVAVTLDGLRPTPGRAGATHRRPSPAHRGAVSRHAGAAGP
jgi:AcrR family transcriptional regulator